MKEFEWVEEGKGYREFLVPADIVNQYGRPRVVDEYIDEDTQQQLQKRIRAKLGDERYKKLVGKHVRLPLQGRIIPVISDPYVDVSFGTGCLKITPAHDVNDFEVGERHHLEPINVMNEDATLNDVVPPEQSVNGLRRSRMSYQRDHP